jgi:hypothetical protein
MFENRKHKLALVVLALVGLGVALSPSALATALSAARDTPELRPVGLVWLTQGSNVIYAGAMVAVNSDGEAAPAADASGYNVIGRAEAYSDNTGSAYLTNHTINVRAGVFRWENGDSITDADIGSLAYVTDDATVQKGASTYNIIAGVIWKVDSSGVWVDTHDIGAQGASTPSSLAVSGNGTVGGNFAVTSNTTVGGNATVAGTLAVTGAVTLAGGITGNVVASGAITGATANVTGNTVVGGNLNVTGTHTNTGAMRVLGALTVDGAVVFTNTVTLSAPAGVGTYTNAATGFTNVFDAGGRLLSHDP